MLKRLKLTNFKQHRDREFTFSQGLVVFKGLNESGKSSTISALLYLWFGAKALPEPLAAVVTYGENEKTLRVEGSFTIDGVDYEAYRAPSGAELVYGSERVTGQTGVTQFMERLLGAKSDVVRQLMIAEQNSVRGILESEKSAGELIESLAELGLIDNLIDKVKNQLSCGPTKGAEGALQALQSAVTEMPEKPSADFSVQEAALASAESELAKVRGKFEELREASVKAQAVLENSRAVQLAINQVAKRESELRNVSNPGMAPYTAQQIEDAKAMESNAKLAAEVKRHKEVTFSTVPVFTGTEEEARAFVEQIDNLQSANASKVSDLKVKRATKLAMKINEGVCSFCKKDISALPEVAQVNDAADAEVKAIDEEIQKLYAEIEPKIVERSLVKEALSVHRANMQKANPAYWRPVAGEVPCLFEWIGPEIADSQSVSVSSASMIAANRQHETALVRYLAAQQELTTLSYPQAVPADEVRAAEEAVEAFRKYESVVRAAHDSVTLAKSALATQRTIFETAMRNYEDAVKRRNKSLEDVKVAEKLLADMEFNNKLIDDLRAARTEIRRRLWATVTAAISIYFSRIRQTETLITQSEGGFLQNGKSVKGLSGSAKDMLGLAIRAALLKTFIPGAPLLVVDEPFSGCDDNREMSGIGVLSTLGFPQTLLVTHSDLADAVANQLVQL